MANKNWLKIDTSLLEGDVWSKCFSKVEAYIYLVKNARWQKNEDEKSGIRFGTGQLVTSFRELASEWGWKLSSVKRYCQKLVELGVIEIHSDQKASCITIVNMKCDTTIKHERYTSGTPNGTPNGTPKLLNDSILKSGVGTPNGTLNGTQAVHPGNSSHAHVVLNLFDDNNINNNIDDNLNIEVDNTPYNPPRGKPQGYEKFDFSFVDDKFYDVFSKWLDYKRDGGGKKFLYKTQKTLETCYEGIVKTSRNIPEAAMEILTYCITSSYQGYFAPRGFWWEWEQKHGKTDTNQTSGVCFPPNPRHGDTIGYDWFYDGEEERWIKDGEKDRLGRQFSVQMKKWLI